MVLANNSYRVKIYINKYILIEKRSLEYKLKINKFSLISGIAKIYFEKIVFFNALQ